MLRGSRTGREMHGAVRSRLGFGFDSPDRRRCQIYSSGPRRRVMRKRSARSDENGPPDFSGGPFCIMTSSTPIGARSLYRCPPTVVARGRRPAPLAPAGCAPPSAGRCARSVRGTRSQRPAPRRGFELPPSAALRLPRNSGVFHHGGGPCRVMADVTSPEAAGSMAGSEEEFPGDEVLEVRS